MHDDTCPLRRGLLHGPVPSLVAAALPAQANAQPGRMTMALAGMGSVVAGHASPAGGRRRALAAAGQGTGHIKPIE